MGKRKNKAKPPPPPPRPRGMPRAQYRELCAQGHGKRFFDNWFNTAGSQKITSSSAETVRIRSVRDHDMVTPDTGSEIAQVSGGFIPASGVISSRPGDATRVFRQAQREMVQVLNGSTGYTVVAVPINPGLSTMLPLFSQVAKLYERYRLLGVRVIIVPFVSGLSTAGQTGRVVVAYVADPLAFPPSTLQAAENIQPNVAGLPYTAIELTLDSKLLAGTRWVRTSRNPAGTDLKTYDPGVVYVSVSGCGATTQIGEIHIEYEVELLNIRTDAAPLLPPIYSFTQVASAPFAMVTNTPQYQSMDDNNVSDFALRNGLGITMDNVTFPGSVKAMRFPPGWYHLVWEFFALESGGGLQSNWIAPVTTVTNVSPGAAGASSSWAVDQVSVAADHVTRGHTTFHQVIKCVDDTTVVGPWVFALFANAPSFKWKCLITLP